MTDKDYMTLALQLARATTGQTSPNPSVGAVIVRNGQIVGLGSHLFAGYEHAEIHALNMAKEKARDATLYVTLEPCVHFGKTPPCTRSIIAAGIKRVVVATLDPNPRVMGKGVKELQAANIEVEAGLFVSEAREINQIFFHSIINKTPYISLKAGMSLDSKLATVSGESKWITNNKSREDAHSYRHSHDAILVGVGTILSDNPSLTTRLPHGGKNPIRIILDTNLRTPINSQVVIDEIAPTWIVTGARANNDLVAKFAKYPQVRVIKMQTDLIELPKLMTILYEQNIMSILVEGGHAVHSSFIQHKLINQLILYISPLLIGGKDAPSLFAGTGFSSLGESLSLKFQPVEYLDDNLKIVARVKED